MANKFSSILNELKSNPNFTKIGDLMQDMVDGNILMRGFMRRQYVLVFIIAGLCILYIGHRYTCDRATRRQRELVKENRDLRFELLSLSASLTDKSRGSVVEDSVRLRLPELQISRVPMIIIEEQE